MQIIAVLREYEAGISEVTAYNWKAKFGGTDVSDAKCLRAVEEESGRQMRPLADGDTG